MQLDDAGEIVYGARLQLSPLPTSRARCVSFFSGTAARRSSTKCR